MELGYIPKTVTTLQIPVDENWAASQGASEESLRSELRQLLAVKLYELQRMTLAQAAHLADMNTWAFMDLLGSQKVSLIQFDDKQLDRELSQH